MRIESTRIAYAKHYKPRKRSRRVLSDEIRPLTVEYKQNLKVGVEYMETGSKTSSSKKTPRSICHSVYQKTRTSNTKFRKSILRLEEASLVKNHPSRATSFENSENVCTPERICAFTKSVGMSRIIFLAFGGRTATSSPYRSTNQRFIPARVLCDAGTRNGLYDFFTDEKYFS